MSLTTATIAIIIYLFASSNLAASLLCYVCTHIENPSIPFKSPTCINPTPNTVNIQRNTNPERTLLNALAKQDSGRAPKRLVCGALLGWFNDTGDPKKGINMGYKRFKSNGTLQVANGCERTSQNVTDPPARFIGYVCYCDTDLCNGQKSSLALHGRLWTIGLLTAWLAISVWMFLV